MTAATPLLEVIRAKRLEHEANGHRDDPVYLRSLLADARSQLAKERELNRDLATACVEAVRLEDEVKRVLLYFKAELESDGLEVTRERLRKLALWWFSRRVEGELSR
jgi:hypothetical protein